MRGYCGRSIRSLFVRYVTGVQLSLAPLSYIQTPLVPSSTKRRDGKHTICRSRVLIVLSLQTVLTLPCEICTVAAEVGLSAVGYAETLLLPHVGSCLIDFFVS